MIGQENETREFRKGMGQPEKSIRSLTAMVNSHGYGELYLGVEEDGSVRGLSPNKKSETVEEWLQELTDPLLKAEIREEEEDGLRYLKVTAYGPEGPYACDGRYYIRIGTADVRCSTAELRRLMTAEAKAPEGIRLSRSERTVLELLKGNEEATQSELAVKSGLSLSGVKKVMRHLQEKGLLQRQGARKNGVWVVKDSSVI